MAQPAEEDRKRWRANVIEIAAAVSDEQLQRRAWFGLGPEQSSPDDDLSGFFGDAAFAEFLEDSENRLTEKQLEAGQRLFRLMRKFSDETPSHLLPDTVIDDPRWKEIRIVAAAFVREMGGVKAAGSEQKSVDKTRRIEP